MDKLLVLTFLFTGSHCADPQYFIDISTPVTHEEAEAHCKSTYGTSLASIVDEDDKVAFKEVHAEALASIPGETWLWVWIGLNSVATNGDEWEWSDGSKCTDFSSRETATIACIDYWRAGDPSSTTEQCGEATVYLDEVSANSLICEGEVYVACNAVNPTVPRSYIIDEGAISTSSWTWNTASTFCEQAYGTTLATVATEEDRVTLEEAAIAAGLGEGTNFFIGLTDIDSTGEWYWQDGTECEHPGAQASATNKCIDYWNGGGEPSGGTEHCITIWFETDFVLKANDVQCDYSLTSIPVCNQDCGEPANFVWETLLESGTDKPDLQYKLSNEPDTLALSISVTVPYLGYSAADDNGYKYGTTYVLDFEDFNAHSSNIVEPGTCQNRKASDFASVSSWDDVWDYNSNGRVLGSAYLAYPPGNMWTLTESDDNCQDITYSATFTWDALTSCTNYAGDKNYIATEDTAGSITLSGTFYVNVVSPYDYKADYGFYRVHQLLSAPFEIVVSKTVYVVGKFDINLLTMDIIAVYKEDEENTFRLVVLTESAEYLKLTRDSLTDSLFSFDASTSTLSIDAFTIATEAETDTAAGASNGCLQNKGYICSQLWVITAADVKCDGHDEYRDFSGKYGIQFDAQCRSKEELGNDQDAQDLSTYCDGWLTDHLSELEGDTGVIALSSPLTWKDEVCDKQVFDVQFDATMSFFVDGYDTAAGANELYQVGEDTVYVKIETDYPSDHLTVFQVELQNVWICTFNPLKDEAEIYNFEPGVKSGGCFDADIDPVNDEYNAHIYDIIGDERYESFALGAPPATNAVQFEFKVPVKIARDKVYVHAQIEVILTSGGQQIGRRRLLIGAPSPKGVNQIDHFVDGFGVGKGPKEHKPQPPVHEHPPQQPQPYTPPVPQPVQQPFVISLQSPWIIAIGGVLAFVLAVNVVFMCYVNCVKGDRGVVSFGRRRYTPVKAADSEFYSERDAINVVSE